MQNLHCYMHGHRNVAAGESQILKAYAYFQEQITKDFSSPEELTTLFSIMKTQLNFVLITITRETPENPYLIFRSLNSTGQDLTQWDLVQNHVTFSGMERRPFARIVCSPLPSCSKSRHANVASE